jgi:ADP-ribose pyrophosphatase
MTPPRPNTDPPQTAAAPEGVEVVERTTLFQGWFRIDRLTLRHRMFGGGWTKPFTREVFERGHAAAVLLYDPAREAVALTEQFRVGALSAGVEPWSVEIVAGIIDAGETAEATAIREVREEAGVAVTEMVPIALLTASPGGSSETVSVFCARIDSAKAGGIFGMPEESEDIRLFTLSLSEALAWTESGRIRNAVSVAAIQWLVINRERLHKAWG